MSAYNTITVDMHQAFRQRLHEHSADKLYVDHFDSIDHSMADPSRPPKTASQRQVNRVLSILDEIAAQNINRGEGC